MLDVSLKSALGAITLNKLKGFGPAAHAKIAAHFDTLGELADANENLLIACTNVAQRGTLGKGGKQMLQAAYDSARKELDDVKAMGADAVTLFEEAYPERLRSIPNAPTILYYAGDIKLLERSVTCIGTRDPTRFGETVADRLTTVLAEDGWSIVSGLAYGIDSICHRAALKAKVPTAAVLGCGLDSVTPGAINLLQAIGDADGLVFTEQPMGKPADFGTLTRRNRIATGLSVATFVVQCGLESGTMHSVKYALLQDRPIFAPAIPEKFADEPMNKAIMDMTTMSPLDFARLCDWKGEYLEAAEQSEASTIAEAISGRDQYPALFARLNSLVTTSMPFENAVVSDISATF